MGEGGGRMWSGERVGGIHVPKSANTKIHGKKKKKPEECFLPFLQPLGSRTFQPPTRRPWITSQPLTPVVSTV